MIKLASERDRLEALSLVPVSRETQGLLQDYLDLLIKWQDIKNLVSAGTLDHAWTRHIADSAQLSDIAPDAKTWLDLGSGAGFPGLVIAILRRGMPGFSMHLVESNSRKCAFLREVARHLRLEVTVNDSRIDAFMAQNSVEFDVVVARALAPLPDLIRMSEKLLTSGTVGVFPKGQDVAGELTEASKYWIINALTVPSKTDPRSAIVRIEGIKPRPQPPQSP